MSAQQQRYPCSLFLAPNGLNELPEMGFKFLFILIGKSTMAFSTGQSWGVLKSWYKGGGPEQGFMRLFTNLLNQSLVSSMAQAKIEPELTHYIFALLITDTNHCLHVIF